MDALNSLPPKPEPGLRPYLWSLDLLTIIQQCKAERFIPESKITYAGADGSELDLLKADFMKVMDKRFGVEIHPDDLVTYQEQNFADYSLRFSVCWQPSTHAVQFRVGPGEGWITQVSDLGITHEVPIGQYLSDPDPGIEPFGKVDLVPYRMAGWNEMERCWVFMPVGALF